MFYKLGILLSFLSIFIFHQALADCDSHTCSARDYSPQLYAREDESQAPIAIFISFSMPDQSLKLWAEQASRIKAPLVIRGFLEDSIQKTTQKAFELFATDRMPELLVDPEAFERFGISVVPAVVVVSEPTSSKEPSAATIPAFELVYGDTSLEDALRLILARGSAAIQKIVAPALARLEHSDD